METLGVVESSHTSGALFSVLMIVSVKPLKGKYELCLYGFIGKNGTFFSVSLAILGVIIHISIASTPC